MERERDEVTEREQESDRVKCSSQRNTRQRGGGEVCGARGFPLSVSLRLACLSFHRSSPPVSAFLGSARGWGLSVLHVLPLPLSLSLSLSLSPSLPLPVTPPLSPSLPLSPLSLCLSLSPSLPLSLSPCLFSSTAAEPRA